MNPYDVFINCPFDRDYQRLLYPIVFCIHDSGLVARSALEIDDGSEIRLDKIYNIITQCRYGIHDLSRTQRDRLSGFPRFNMPLELGLFLGAKKYGGGAQASKRCLILEKDRFTYQKYCSDIAGQDIRHHSNTVLGAITAVRNWLRATAVPKGTRVDGPSIMRKRYARFRRQLPSLCENANLQLDEMQFIDYTTFVEAWLREDDE